MYQTNYLNQENLMNMDRELARTHLCEIKDIRSRLDALEKEIEIKEKQKWVSNKIVELVYIVGGDVWRWSDKDCVWRAPSGNFLRDKAMQSLANATQATLTYDTP